MASKKIGLTASTPAVHNNPSTFRGIVDTSAPSSIEESSTFAIRTAFSDESSANTNIVPTKQTTLELLCKAIETVGAPRKGASYVAILKWITNNKENVVLGQLRAILKKTVLKALETGMIKRATASKNSTGLQGYFLLNKDSLIKDIKIKGKKKATSKKKKVSKGDKASEVEESSGSEETREDDERLNVPSHEVVGRKKVASKATSKQNGVKKVLPPSKVEKKTTKPPKKGKAKPESDPKAAAVSKVKAKTAKVSSKIAKVARALMGKTDPVPEDGNDDEGNAAASSSKAKGTAKTKAVSNLKPKPKTKAGKKENIKESEAVPKSKKGKATKKQIEDEAKMTEVEMVEGKTKKKAATKPLKSQKEIVNEPPNRKKFNPVTEMPRKDLSDTELTILKPNNHKSFKNYSSDTEIEVFKKKKTAKKTKNRSDTAATKTSTNEESEAGPSKPKIFKRQKAKATS